MSVIAGLPGTAFGAGLQGYFNVQLERQKFEFSLIQKALETTDTSEATKRLVFLVDSGVINSLDSAKIKNIAEYKPTQLPVFPPPIVANARVYLLAENPDKTRLFGELRSELIKAGFNVMGEKQLPRCCQTVALQAACRLDHRLARSSGARGLAGIGKGFGG